MSYSMIISFAKITFGILALILVGMIFMMSTDDDFGEPISVETKDLDFGSGFQIDGAHLSGLNVEGDKFNFKVEKINPSNSMLPIIIGENITGIISFNSDNLINITAENATLDTKKNVIELQGNLRLKTKSVQLYGSSILINFNKNTIKSGEKIHLMVPKGSIEAGNIFVTKPGAKGASLKFVMTDGVKLKFLL